MGGCRPPDPPRPPALFLGGPAPQTPRLAGCRPLNLPRGVWGGSNPPTGMSGERKASRNKAGGMGGGSPPSNEGAKEWLKRQPNGIAK